VNGGMAPDRHASTALTLSYRPKRQLCCDIFNEGILNGKNPLKSHAPTAVSDSVADITILTLARTVI